MSSLVLFVNDLATMKKFYADLLAYQVSEEVESFARMSSGSDELVLHQIPEEYLEQISNPPKLREDCVWKPTFTVDSVATSRAVAIELGGAVADESRQWELGDYVYCNGNDPEGNVIQVRQLVR